MKLHLVNRAHHALATTAQDVCVNHCRLPREIILESVLNVSLSPRAF
jgi:hypothetical protein